MYYMMCPYLVSGVYQQDEDDGGVTGETDTRDERCVCIVSVHACVCMLCVCVCLCVT